MKLKKIKVLKTNQKSKFLVTFSDLSVTEAEIVITAAMEFLNVEKLSEFKCFNLKLEFYTGSEWVEEFKRKVICGFVKK